MHIKVDEISNLFDAIQVYNKISEDVDVLCTLDFLESGFIRNNYLSIVGLAIKQREKYNKKTRVIPPDFKKNRKVYSAMSNIGFLKEFKAEANSLDYHKTMVEYTHIPLNSQSNIETFYVYFMERFEQHMENLSPELLKKIIQKIYELFSNVFRHSGDDLGLFCSGQFYPTNKKFNFTIVDGGKTIPSNVNSFLLKRYKEKENIRDLIRGKKFTPLTGVEAIKWALQKNHSTSGEGGLGLSLLEQLIAKSDGKLEIISKKGYYAITNGKKHTTELLNESFPGTIISIELNTSGNKYYYLKGESQSKQS